MTLPRNLTIPLIAGTTALAAAVSVQAQVKPTGDCHKPLGLKQDFVFTYERLKAATR